MKHLLAKSYNRKEYSEPPDYALLTQHSRDVAAACKALAEKTGRLALRNADLSSEQFEKFKQTLVFNGWLQDLGKANSHFQDMVNSQNGLIQLIRHEIVSGILVYLNEDLQEWLKPLENLKLIAVWGAMGHHRKFDNSTRPNQSSSLTVYLKHDDFKTILQEMAADLGLEQPPCFTQNLIIARTQKEVCDLAARDSLINLCEQFEKAESEFEDEKSRRFLALIKGFGIVADVAASAIARQKESAQLYSLANFVTEELSIGLKPHDLNQLINNWAWKNLITDEKKAGLIEVPSNFSLQEDSLYDFQKNLSATTSYLTLAEAGCGSGKSLGSYLWAKSWFERLFENGQTNLRMFFCLPTTGTTTEHFKDYALESGIPASLSHSRSSVDLKTMAVTANQEEAREQVNKIQAAQDALKAEQDKIEALALWSTPLVVTTADTVLGLMANARKSIYSLPAIMQSVIVFDEIHAFDDYLFGHLLIFLKNFPYLPILLMTASLPKDRRQAIQKVRPDLCFVSGPKHLETIKRYEIEYPIDVETVWEKIKTCIESKGKVLWVRNRVVWANQSYQEACQKFENISIDVYHSRLRYKDRSIRHRRVIDKFKEKDKAAILVATQVAEMSLDLSADLLITDIAPIPSLIQRLGRLNRKNPECSKPALICLPPKVKGNSSDPYEQADLDIAEKWIKELKDLNRSLDQRDLVEHFINNSAVQQYNYTEAEERAYFFGFPNKSGLWRTRPGLTRSDGYTISVILERDLKKCKEFEYDQPSRDWLRRHEVSIPLKNSALQWDLVAGIRVAPSNEVKYEGDEKDSDNYDENTYQGTGAVWREK